MKITISPSEDQKNEPFPYYAITVDCGNDDAPIEMAVEMFFQAMTGWGYDPCEVHKQLNEFTR